MLAVIPALLLSAAGCGGGQARPAPTTVAATTGQSPIPPRSAPSATVGRSGASKPGSTSATGGTPTASTAAPVSPPPDGLRAATGFETYENCSAACTGSVSAALRRPLNIGRLAPGMPCPVSHPPLGPISPLGFATDPTLMPTTFINSAWGGQRVTWTSSASYKGPVLIRGRQLDGPHAVGFGEGNVPYDELQLSAPGMGAPTAPGGGRAWLSFTRVRARGCYAYQVDGDSFSAVIVFASR